MSSEEVEIWRKGIELAIYSRSKQEDGVRRAKLAVFKGKTESDRARKSLLSPFNVLQRYYLRMKHVVHPAFRTSSKAMQGADVVLGFIRLIIEVRLVPSEKLHLLWRAKCSDSQ